jgi:hypothetical protein
MNAVGLNCAKLHAGKLNIDFHQSASSENACYDISPVKKFKREKIFAR